jgi:hypothetical protein
MPETSIICNMVLNQSWKTTGITLTQEVSSDLAIVKVSCFQLKTLENIHQDTPTFGKFTTYLTMNNEMDICLWNTHRSWFDLENIIHHIFICETL